MHEGSGREQKTKLSTRMKILRNGWLSKLERGNTFIIIVVLIFVLVFILIFF